LYFGTAYRLASDNSYSLRGRQSEAFNGSLQAGIDVKATLRAFVRGNHQIYVRTRRQQREPAQVELQQPFVYVLQAPQHNRSRSGLDWELLRAGALSADHFVGSTAARFRQITEQFGNKFISTVLYREQRPKPREASECLCITGYQIIWGGVSYGNPVMNAQQGAQWLTETNFKCCPVLESMTMDELLEHFGRKFGVSLDPNDWPDTLVRLAIPFAKERVLIIAPSRNVISHQAQLEARKRRIRLDFVPLSYLSAPLVREIQSQWHVRPLDRDGMEWSDDVIRLLGRPDTHFDLLPPSIRRQAFPNG
jgi:hypothetical protein